MMQTDLGSETCKVAPCSTTSRRSSKPCAPGHMSPRSRRSHGRRPPGCAARRRPLTAPRGWRPPAAQSPQSAPSPVQGICSTYTHQQWKGSDVSSSCFHKEQAEGNGRIPDANGFKRYRMCRQPPGTWCQQSAMRGLTRCSSAAWASAALDCSCARAMMSCVSFVIADTCSGSHQNVRIDATAPETQRCLVASHLQHIGVWCLWLHSGQGNT